jgi:contactin associated protein-like 2
MDYWPGSSPGSWQCACGLRGDCYDPDKVCNCDSGHEGWLQDGGDITNKDILPVRALHFGDTGTPLDTKEGRFSLGQLKCSEDTSFETKTGVIRLQRVINNQEDIHGHFAEVFFEFMTEIEKSVVLFYERVDSDSYSKVVLVSDRRIVYEWSSGGRMENIAVEIENRLNDGRWHTINIERNVMEVMVVVDRQQMTNVRVKKQKIENDPSYTVSNLEVWRCLSIWRDPYHIFAGPFI